MGRIRNDRTEETYYQFIHQPWIRLQIIACDVSEFLTHSIDIAAVGFKRFFCALDVDVFAVSCESPSVQRYHRDGVGYADDIVYTADILYRGSRFRRLECIAVQV